MPDTQMPERARLHFRADVRWPATPIDQAESAALGQNGVTPANSPLAHQRVPLSYMPHFFAPAILIGLLAMYTIIAQSSININHASERRRKGRGEWPPFRFMLPMGARKAKGSSL